MSYLLVVQLAYNLVWSRKLNVSCPMLFSAAINQLTKNLACEWAKDSIRSNCVVPGTTNTPLVEHVTFLLPVFIWVVCFPFDQKIQRYNYLTVDIDYSVHSVGLGKLVYMKQWTNGTSSELPCPPRLTVIDLR